MCNNCLGYDTGGPMGMWPPVMGSPKAAVHNQSLERMTSLDPSPSHALLSEIRKATP